MPLPLVSRHTRLRHPSPAFVDELYELATTDQIPWQWPGPETPDGFRRSLWSGVLAQFAIESRRDERGVGLVTAYGANLAHGYCYVSTILHPSFRLRAWPLEGAVLFGNYLFTKFNLRNVYAETTEPYFGQFRSGMGSLFEVEACFHGRMLVNGEPRDQYILRFSRDRWLDAGERALRRCTAGPADRPQPVPG